MYPFPPCRLTAFVTRVFTKGQSCGGLIDQQLIDHGVNYLYKIQAKQGANRGRFTETHWWYLHNHQTWIKVSVTAALYEDRV